MQFWFSKNMDLQLSKTVPIIHISFLDQNLWIFVEKQKQGSRKTPWRFLRSKWPLEILEIKRTPREFERKMIQCVWWFKHKISDITFFMCILRGGGAWIFAKNPIFSKNIFFSKMTGKCQGTFPDTFEKKIIFWKNWIFCENPCAPPTVLFKKWEGKGK